MCRALGERRWVRRLVWTLASLAVVLVMTRPSGSEITGTLPQNLGDPALNTWILSWESHAFLSHPSNWFNGNIFFPSGKAIGYSEMMLPLVPVYAVVEAVSSPLTAHNVLLILLLVLSVMATHTLARRLGIGTMPSFLAGVAFSFTAYTFVHLGHLQLMTIGFFPLAFIATLRMFERRRIVDGVLAGLATFALVTGCLYYGAIWGICLGVLVVLDAIVMWRRDRREWLRPIAAFAATSMATLGPIVVLYIRFQHATGFTRALSPEGGLNPSDLLAPAPGSYVYRSAATAMASRAASNEHTFFPGVVVLALAALGSAVLARGLVYRLQDGRGRRWERRQREWIALVVCGAIALATSLGPTVLGLPAPFRLMFHVVPGFDSIRVPARLVVPALLVLALCAAKGVELLGSWLRSVELVGAVAVVVVVVELAAPFPRVSARPDVDDVDLYEVVGDLAPGPVVELPIAGPSDGPNGVYLEAPRMLFSVGDWRPRFNGTSGGNPPSYYADAAVIAQFPAPPSLDALRRLSIRYVVVHKDSSNGFPGYDESQIAAIAATSGVQVVARSAAAVVFEVTAVAR